MPTKPTRRTILILTSLILTAATPTAPAQPPEALPTQTEASRLPAFEVATIKPIDPNAGGAVGFYSRPGGRVLLGYASVKMMMYYAFDVQQYQISGGPAWVGTDSYNVDAVPPDTSTSRTAAQPRIKATPSDEQRKMIQRLLIDRFGLKIHWETKEGPVYILTRGKKPLQLKEPRDKDADSRGGVRIKQGGIVDGSAFGTNATMPFLARQLGGGLNSPVLDKTGLQGSYDFELPPSDPENHDYAVAASEAMEALGLKLERGKGPIQVIVIDQVERPSAN
jgi:uncharacterized protein (TIGR03435 family)